MEVRKEDFRFKLTGKTLVIIDWANVYGWFKDLSWKINPQRLFEYLSTYPEISEKRLYHGVEVGDSRSESFGAQIKTIGFTFITKDVKFVPVSLEKSHFKKIIKELFDVLDSIKLTNTEISTKLFEIKQKIEKRLAASGEPDVDSAGNVLGEIPPYAPEDKDVYDSTYDLIEELDTELKKLNINIANLQKNLSQPVLRRKCDFDCEIVMDTMLRIGNFNTVILFSGDGDYKAIAEYLLNLKKKVIIVHPFGKRGKEFNILLERETNKPYFLAVEKIKNVLI